MPESFIPIEELPAETLVNNVTLGDIVTIMYSMVTPDPEALNTAASANTILPTTTNAANKSLSKLESFGSELPAPTVAKGPKDGGAERSWKVEWASNPERNFTVMLTSTAAGVTMQISRIEITPPQV